jgi:hypothetical protein
MREPPDKDVYARPEWNYVFPERRAKWFRIMQPLMEPLTFLFEPNCDRGSRVRAQRSFSVLNQLPRDEQFASNDQHGANACNRECNLNEVHTEDDDHQRSHR